MSMVKKKRYILLHYVQHVYCFVTVCDDKSVLTILTNLKTIHYYPSIHTIDVLVYCIGVYKD